jgi:DNA gyrase/topoisomerase IV subunit A
VIKPSKLTEWINEIEERPLFAPIIVRRLYERLIELDEMNEELRAANLTLRSGQKVQEFERKIADLEYQVELLKRQVQNGTLPNVKNMQLLVFNPDGKILCMEISPSELVTDRAIALIGSLPESKPGEIRMAAVDSQDELLFMFSSGRIATQPAAELPAVQGINLDWQEAASIEMRSGETLITTIPITRAPLVEQCIQISRRSTAKSFSRKYFQAFIANHNIGKGTKSDADQAFHLTLCNKSDILVMLTREGYISALRADRLSVTAEEIIKLGMNDYLVASFIIGADQSLVIASQDGCLYVQKPTWLTPESATGGKRRLLLSKGRAGSVQVIGGTSANDQDWGFLLSANGEIRAHRIADIPSPGSSARKGKGEIQGRIEALAFTSTDLFSQQD